MYNIYKYNIHDGYASFTFTDGNLKESFLSNKFKSELKTFPLKNKTKIIDLLYGSLARFRKGDVTLVLNYFQVFPSFSFL